MKKKYIISIIIIIISLVIISPFLLKKEEKVKNKIIEKDKTIPEKKSSSPQVNHPKVEKKEESKKPLSPTTQPGLKKVITGKRFIKRLKKDIPLFGEEKLIEIERGLISNKDVDPSEFALEFTKSENEKVKNFGYELLTSICIMRPEDFRPNEFYMAYAKKGLSSSSMLSEIIEKTDDDFCREWACELSADIYYNNAPEDNSRKNKLSQFKRKEENIYNFTKEVLSSEKDLKEIIRTKGNLSDIIIKQWGNENRMPLKMQALVSILDLMDETNIQACSSKALNIIDKYNFNYNILGRLNGKPLSRPPISTEIKLKRLADAVFKDEYQDTYLWLPREKGGFTAEELEKAVMTKDIKEMQRMLEGLKKIIANILKPKILIGLGNNELMLLRYFNHANWKNEPFEWDNKLLTIKNNSGKSISLTLQRDDSSNPPVKFLILQRSRFIWFLPKGEYSISSLSGKSAKKISIKKENVKIEVEN